MDQLTRRTILSFTLIATCLLLVAPNFLEQELALVFRKNARLSTGEKIPITPGQIQDFTRDRENGLGLYFPGRECRPEAGKGVSAEYRCILKDRFITAARVNELAQANPELIDDKRTELVPHPIERLVGRLPLPGKPEDTNLPPEQQTEFVKNLKIKLGLDLQGGMRAVFRADFEAHLASLSEKYKPLIAELQKELETASEDDRSGIELRISEYEDQLDLNEGRKQELLSEAKRVIDKRLASQNLTEPEVRVQPGSYSIAVDMPGVANSSEVLDYIKDVVRVEYRLVNNEATRRANENPELAEALAQIQAIYRSGIIDRRDIEDLMRPLPGILELDPDTDGRLFLFWRRGQKSGSPNLPREFRVLGPTVLDGDDMTDAQGNINPNSAYYKIDFVLNGGGATKFCDVTTNSINRSMAILWGDRVVSDPVIQGPICGGNGIITGQFTQDEASEIANVIREGALPLALEVLSVSFIGPSLGQESIIAGILSIFIGFLLIIIFMLGYYRLSGMIATFALLVNLVIVAAVLSLLEFTLTLPGFAGVILTVGMAVDANVIIFEKIKEELAEGKSPSLAIDSGYNASFWTILDANVTTIIAAIILFYTKDGPIMGFAITLFWGLLSSMFTSLVLTRLVFEWVQKFTILRKLSIGWAGKVEGAA